MLDRSTAAEGSQLLPEFMYDTIIVPIQDQSYTTSIYHRSRFEETLLYFGTFGPFAC